MKHHIYARTEKGLFTGRAGYDTVKASEGLDENFVRRHIHPYCFYQEHGFSDEEKKITPDVYFFAHTGDALIFGRNIYIKGERNSFFSHACLITENDELRAVYENPDLAINYGGFLREWRDSELDSANITSTGMFDMFYTKDAFFNMLGITEGVFESILFNIIQAYFKKRQLYIKLNANRRICSEAARQLMRYAFAAIPSCFRKKLSYISYSPDLDTPVFFDIVFVDRHTDLSRAAYGYALDLTGNSNIENDSLFLKIARINIFHSNKTLLKIFPVINEPNSWRKLDECAGSALKAWTTLKGETKKNLGEHNYFYFLRLVTDLYYIEEGEYDNSLFVLQKYAHAAAPFKNPPEVTEIEYLFTKSLNKAYAVPLRFDLCGRNIYYEMINKLDETRDKFKFAVLGRLYLSGANRYLNAEKYDVLNKELRGAVARVSDLTDNESADIFTKKMQEVIMGEISVYLRQS